MASDGKNADDTRDVEATAKKIPYPKSVFFILTNEFCERFSYYGMRTILILYLKGVLKFNEDDSTVIYHTFAMLCYFTPLFGSILADSLLGKFRTIFYLSIVYAAGNVILSLAAIDDLSLPQIPISMIGLLLIAIGTGGIKPCVSSFGGDQFKLPEQAAQLASFFSVFYFSINSGSLISTFITPILRKDVHCFGNQDCYPLAFGVPAALMITSLVVFLLGRFMYTIREPTGNVVVAVMKTIGHALSRKRKNKGPKRDHWMDYADDKYAKRDIEDIKIVLRVLFLYIPLPLFWALFDQQGSRWTFQASRMNGDVGGFVFKPDQMQVVNPLLVLGFIPIFDRGIYPLLGKFGILKKPLQRLTLGGIFAGIAFTVSGLIEVELQKTYPIELGKSESYLSVINHSPQNLTAHICLDNKLLDEGTFPIEPRNSEIFGVVEGNQSYTLRLNGGNNPCADNNLESISFHLYHEQVSSIVITHVGSEFFLTFPHNLTAIGEKYEDEDENEIDPSPWDALKKSEEGMPFVRFIQVGLWEDPLGDQKPGDEDYPNFNTTVGQENQKRRIVLEKVKHAKSNNIYEFKFETNSSVYSDWRSTLTREIDVSKYQLKIVEGTGDAEKETILNEELEFKLGASYVITVVKESNGTYSHQLHLVVEPNSLHMFWLFPQYIIMTMGEIMFSITIMDFSYSQAPVSMKSVMQSAWLMTVAFGNLIDVIIAGAKLFDKQYKEFFLFAGLMYLDMIIFSYMAWKYVPADHTAIEHEEEENENKEGKTNSGYDSDKER